MLLFLLIITNILWIIILLTNNIITHYVIKKFKYIHKFLTLQLRIVISQAKIKKFSPTIAQKQDLAYYASFLNFNKKLCFAFDQQSIKKWFKQYFTKTSEYVKTNRPRIPDFVKKLVILFKKQNKEWGYGKIAGQLNDLSHKISKTSVGRILKHYYHELNINKPKKLKNLIKKFLNSFFACDFKIVEDNNGNQYFLLFFISLFSRKIIHYNITTTPIKDWVKQQLKEISLGDKQVFLITDNDIKFKDIDYEMLSITRINIKPRAPNMNAHIERFIRSFKYEALLRYPKDKYNEKFLRYICKEYIRFYNNFRPHQGIGNVLIPVFLKNKKQSNNNFVNELDCNIKKLKRMRFLDNNHSYYYYKNCA